MPNPKRYAPTEEGKKHFMRDCMHTVLHVEKKDRDQGIAQCMNVWRNRNKKKAMADRIARQISAELSGSESLYGFCGWLTTQDDPTVMSAHDDSAPIAKLISRFCKTNNLTEPREGWDKELIHPSKRASAIIHNFLENSMAEGHLKQADYPDHPKDIVLPKSDWSSRPVAEIDIWNYYSGVNKKMLPELKGRNLFIGVVPKEYKAGQKPIYIRHPYHGNTEYIRIDSTKEFETYHSGRTVEIHVTMPQQAPYYIIDIDAPGKFSDTKKIVAEVADALEKIPEVKNVEIRYTGKRGFHLLGWLKKSKNVNDARNFLHDWLKETFGERDDVVLGESPKGSKPALGLSPMKINGGQVALWSLRVSGLCCIEVPRAQLMSFEREDASIDKVYKKATGRTFSFGKEHVASIIYNYINEDARIVG